MSSQYRSTYSSMPAGFSDGIKIEKEVVFDLLFYLHIFNLFFRSDYFDVITSDDSFSPSAVALRLIVPEVVSGRMIARQIP